MVKHVFFSVLLLISSIHYSFSHSGHHHNFIKLEHWAIHLTDGKTPGMDGDACTDCLQARGQINKLIHGQKDRQTGQYIKKYELDGKKVALEDLIKIEAEYGDHIVLKNGQPWKPYYNCLQSMKYDFIEFSESLMGEANTTRNTTMHLIEEWCKKSGRHNSLLHNWGTEDERELLLKSSATDFHQLILDLKNFLHDLMYSCPKGRELFKVERISTMALKAAFQELTKKSGTVFEQKLDEAIAESLSLKGSNAHQIDHYKKRKFHDNKLSDDILKALEKTGEQIDYETFEATFFKYYEKQCEQFDQSFKPE